MADETKSGGAGETSDRAITGGTDKYGPGGTSGNADRAPEGGTYTDVEETGDIMGATTTHAGAGGQMDSSGGTGTAPVEPTVAGGDDNT